MKAVGCAVGLLGLSIACDARTTVRSDVHGEAVSQSGHFRVDVRRVRPGSSEAHVTVTEISTGQAFEDPTRYFAVQRFYVEWGPHDRLRIHSADVGSFTYEFCRPCSKPPQIPGTAAPDSGWRAVQ